MVLKRDEAYIGVLIDDLVTKGVDEPYRMFTSRAEYRILLRQDNADERLTKIGRSIGLVDDFRWKTLRTKKQAIDNLTNYLKELSLSPTEINPYLASVGEASIDGSKRAADLLVRPNVNLNGILENVQNVPRGTWEEEVLEATEIEIKYAGYIDREKRVAEKILRLEDLAIPEDFDFFKLTALSMECRIKLDRYRPRTIAQASRISGVSPADISVLLVYFGR